MTVTERAMRLAGAFICLLAAVALTLSAGVPERAPYSGRMLPGERPIAPEIDAIAPPFSAATSNGAVVDLLTLRGAPVVVNFWATWCEPCRAEMPGLQALYAAHRDEGLRVLAVNLGEPAQAAEAWAGELGLTFDLVLDPRGEIASLYRLRGQPSTYIISPQGVITQIHYGPTTEAALEAALKPFLSGA